MSFEAKYHSPCAAGDHISPGDLVQYDGDDELRHVNCQVVDPDQPRRNERHCPDCFTIHAGEC